MAFNPADRHSYPSNAGTPHVGDRLTEDDEEHATPVDGAYGAITLPFLQVTGLPGATSGTRVAGGTTSGSPVTGTFEVGDLVIDKTGILWVCTVAGTPGTWVDASSSGRITASASSTAQQTGITSAVDVTGLSLSNFVVGTRPVHVTAMLPIITAAGGQASNVLASITDASAVVKASAATYLASAGQGSIMVVEEISTPGTYSRKVQVSRSGTGGGTITNNGAGVAHIVSRLFVRTV